MKLNYLFVAALLLACTWLHAQKEPPKELLLKDFNEKKVLQELKDAGLDPDLLDTKKREYMMRKVVELGYKLPPKTLPPGIKPKPNPGARYTNNATLTSNCNNSDFSLQNFTNWTCYTWTNPNATVIDWTTAPTWVAGQMGNMNDFLAYGPAGTAFPNSSSPTPNRHCIMTTPATNNDPTVGPVVGYDSICINPFTTLADIPLIPPGNTTPVLRLGNAKDGYNATSPWYAETEQAVYAMTVTSNSTQFTYKYAVVLNNPGGGSHLPNEQPFFQITVKDQNGNQIGGPCGLYYVTTDLASDTANHFIEQTGSMYNGYCDVFYKNWTTVSIDLSAQMGQNITIEFRTADCSRSGHFGYAYLTAYCGTLQASATGICGGVGSSVLTAPPGYSSYQWYGPPNGSVLIPGATSSTYTATGANVGDVFAVQMVSPSGCNSLLNITITSSYITANYSTTPTCEGASNGIASASINGGGNFGYTWTNSGGSTVGTSQTINNLPAGTYSVHIVDNTGVCPPKDTTVHVGITYPQLQNVTDSLCGTQVVLTTPGSSNPVYTWYDNTNLPIAGANASSYTVTNGSGGQHYTETYINPGTGCRDSLRHTLNPININFAPLSSAPCNGGNNGSITITASQNNAFPTYDWNINGPVPSSGAGLNMPPNNINASSLTGGTYTVTINPTGNPTCKYTTTITLTPGVIPPPTLDTLKGCKLDNLSIPTNTVSGNTHSWWQGSTSLGNSYPYVTNGVTGGVTYTDTIRNVFGCISVYKALVKEKDFKGTLVPQTLPCHDDSIGKIKVNITQEINGPLGTPYIFTWDFPSPYTDPAPINAGVGVPKSSTESNLHAGFYSITVQSGNCVKTFTYDLVNPALLPRDSLFAYFCPKDSIVWLFAEPGHPKYNWVNSGVPVANYNNDSIQVTPETIYNYYVWYTVGTCRDTASVFITQPSYNAYRPQKQVNIFTPNADNHNDFFYPFYDEKVSQYQIEKRMDDYHIYIYNRWGKLVFESHDYTTAWNGFDQRGEKQDDGTYYWIAKYKSNCSSKADIVEMHGYVQLLR